MNTQVFYDENGHPMEFEVRGKFTVDDTDYVAMAPVIDLEPLIYILRVAVDEEGKEYLEGIDDDELDLVKDVYEELMKEQEE